MQYSPTATMFTTSTVVGCCAVSAATTATLVFMLLQRWSRAGQDVEREVPATEPSGDTATTMEGAHPQRTTSTTSAAGVDAPPPSPADIEPPGAMAREPGHSSTKPQHSKGRPAEQQTQQAPIKRSSAQ